MNNDWRSAADTSLNKGSGSNALVAFVDAVGSTITGFGVAPVLLPGRLTADAAALFWVGRVDLRGTGADEGPRFVCLLSDALLNPFFTRESIRNYRAPSSKLRKRRGWSEPR